MAPVNVRVNPIGIAIFTVCLIFGFLYIFGIPDCFRKEPRVSMKELLSVSISLAQKGGDRVRTIYEGKNLNEAVKGMTKEGAKEMLTTGDLESHKAIYYGFSKMYPGIKVVSEEHDIKPVDFHQVESVPTSLPEVDEVIKSDQSIPVSRIAIWIDPLDATQEYTEGLTQYVTTLVCVVVDGEPKIGVINIPFAKQTVWAWDSFGRSKNLVTGAADGNKESIIVSRSHQGEVQSVVKEALGDKAEIVPAGGAGYKTLEVIKGSVNAYTHITQIKKWDICAGNAILNAIGGKMTTLDGDFINYSPAEPEKNERGLLATANSKMHYNYLEKLGAKFRVKLEEKNKAKVEVKKT